MSHIRKSSSTITLLPVRLTGTTQTSSASAPRYRTPNPISNPSVRNSHLAREKTALFSLPRLTFNHEGGGGGTISKKIICKWAVHTVPLRPDCDQYGSGCPCSHTFSRSCRSGFSRSPLDVIGSDRDRSRPLGVRSTVSCERASSRSRALAVNAAERVRD